jgi:exopolysaccharide biosynthesis operon protein EpsL
MAWQLRSEGAGKIGARIIVLLVSATVQHAWAEDKEQVLTPYVQYSLLYDDNLLRVRDAQAAMASVGTDKMSDTLRSEVGGLRFERLFSRQRIKLDASVTKTTYDYFKQFNNDGRDLSANWGWVIGNRLSGDVGYVYSQALTPFQNLRVLEKNIRTMQTRYATAAWQMHPDWTVRTQFSHFGLGYDLLSQQSNNFTQDMVELGLDYTARSGSIAGVQFRRTRGNYPYDSNVNGVFINNSFEQEDLKARILWLFSGKTKLQFLGGLTKRDRNSSTGGVNFIGFNARLVADWAATGKTGLKMNLWREIGGLNDVDANYALTDGVSLAAIYRPTDKLRFDGLIDYERRNYNGASIVTGVTPSNRKDTYQKASFGVTYFPTRSWSLLLSVYRESVQSNIDSFGYVSNGISLSTRYEF